MRGGGKTPLVRGVLRESPQALKSFDETRSDDRCGYYVGYEEGFGRIRVLDVRSISSEAAIFDEHDEVNLRYDLILDENPDRPRDYITDGTLKYGFLVLVDQIKGGKDRIVNVVVPNDSPFLDSLQQLAQKFEHDSAHEFKLIPPDRR